MSEPEFAEFSFQSLMANQREDSYIFSSCWSSNNESNNKSVEDSIFSLSPQLSSKHFALLDEEDDNDIFFNKNYLPNSNQSIENQSFDSELDSNKLESTQSTDKKHYFAVQLSEEESTELISHKRGRKPKNEQQGKKNPYHTKYSFDNILRKIKVMFSSFCLQLINSTILYINNGCQKFKFRKITAAKTKNATISFNKVLLNSSIKSIFIDDLSSKFREEKKDLNKDNYEKIINSKSIDKYQALLTIFNMSYLEVFNNFFLENNSKMFFGEAFEECVYFKCSNLEDNLEKLRTAGEDQQYIKRLETIAKNYFVNYFLEGRKPKNY